MNGGYLVELSRHSQERFFKVFFIHISLGVIKTKCHQHLTGVLDSTSENIVKRKRNIIN